MAGADRGGAEGFFERLVPALHLTGAPQHALIRHNKERAHTLEASGVNVTQSVFRGGITRMFDRRTVKDLREVMKFFEPKIILGWMNRGGAAVPTSKSGYTTMGRLGGYYDLRYYQKCDFLLANTHDLARYIVSKGWPANRTIYKPNFVDTNLMDPQPRDRHETPADAFLVVALGRLTTNKAFDVLLEAMASAPGVYLWLAGKGPLEAKLRHQVKQLGIKSRIRFLGWRQDTAALYAAADVFVCPSRHEPLGNVVLEGWAHGCPVIASKAQGPLELITHDENGILVDVDDSDQMAQAIMTVKSNTLLRQTIAEAGAEKYQKEFTKEIVVRDYLTFFQEVAS